MAFQESDSDLSEELFGIYDPEKDKNKKSNQTEKNMRHSVVSWQEAAKEKQTIYPDIHKIETTKMLAQRLNKRVYDVHHDTNWSKIFDLTLDTEWRFDPSKITRFLPDNDAFTIPLLSPIECKKLIQLCELYGFEDCGYFKQYRSNTRLITNDPKLSENLYHRIIQIMPKTYKTGDFKWEICGLNERFRWCKYVGGQKFGTHVDAVYYRSLAEKSFYTVNIYLNKGGQINVDTILNNENDDDDELKENEREAKDVEFSGGRTQFFGIDDETGEIIKEPVWSQEAESGLAVIFNQAPEEINHNGELVLDGKKYLMRTDVMYKIKSKSK